MNTVHLTRIAGITLLLFGLILGTTIAYAGIFDTFKIKENKMFVELLTDDDSSNPPEQYALPSTIGRTGHIYIYKLTFADLNGTGSEVIVLPPTDGTIERGSITSVELSGSGNIEGTVTFVGDEARNTWWVLSSEGAVSFLSS